MKGAVSVKRATGDEWLAAVNGTVLYDDDKLRTERGGAAELRFPSGTVVAVSEDTLLGIAETRAAPGRPQADVTVLRGAVDIGVNLIDPADVYGPHVAEEMIREL